MQSNLKRSPLSVLLCIPLNPFATGRAICAIQATFLSIRFTLLLALVQTHIYTASHSISNDEWRHFQFSVLLYSYRPDALPSLTLHAAMTVNKHSLRVMRWCDFKGRDVTMQRFSFGRSSSKAMVCTVCIIKSQSPSVLESTNKR